MSKKYAIFITCLFCLFITGFLVAGAVSPDRTVSGRETLQTKPEPSVETVLNGKFMTDFEQYCNDQFFGRDAWVNLKAAAELAVGKSENNGTYILPGDTLISRFDYGEKEQKRTDTNAKAVNTFFANAKGDVYFALIPGQATVWAHKLPEGAPNVDQKAIIDSVYAQVEAPNIDIYAALMAHKDEEIFYRTDHHWTSLGAYYGYAALMEGMGLTPVSLGEYQKTVVTEAFYGTTFSNSGVRNVKPDSIWAYVPDTGLEVINNFSGKPEAGSLYNEAALEKLDKYTYFLGGNQPLAIIKNPAVQGPKLLILRDSYSDSLAPFLAAHFSEIHLFDLRYNRGSASEYMEQNGIDKALVLYSVPNFVTDASFFALK